MKVGKLEPLNKSSSGSTSRPTNSQGIDNSKNDNNSTGVIDVKSKPDSTSVISDTSPKINPVHESASAGMDYINSCVFVGDSLTLGLASYKIVPLDNVVASIGMNISKIDSEKIKMSFGEVTAIEALKKLKPATIYIMLGSNGISWLASADMIKKYSAFVDEIKTALPNSKIYILSIPPVTADKEISTESKVSNAKIDGYNSDLLKMANSKNVYFVDSNTGLKNNQGKLDTDRAEKDGMHFKRATYDIMLDYIMKHVSV